MELSLDLQDWRFSVIFFKNRNIFLFYFQSYFFLSWLMIALDGLGVRLIAYLYLPITKWLEETGAERERERVTIKHFSALKNNINNKMDEGWKFSSIWKLFFRSWVTKKIIVHLNLLKTVFDYDIKHPIEKTKR